MELQELVAEVVQVQQGLQVEEVEVEVLQKVEEVLRARNLHSVQ